MEFVFGSKDYGERFKRREAGNATDEDHRLLKLYSMSGLEPDFEPLDVVQVKVQPHLVGEAGPEPVLVKKPRRPRAPRS